MYVPHFNAMEDADEIRDLVRAVGSAEVVTVGSDGFPQATLLPVIWDGERLIFHMARANPQWTMVQAGSPALAIVTGAQAYISPSWYPSKEEHGRVVPTWNYSAVHFTGRVEIHHDSGWLLDAVTRLTDLHERHRERSWSVTDAPERYIEKQLRAIVGLEMTIERVEAKAKLSQNRSAEDRSGVIEGLLGEGGGREHQLANTMDTQPSRVPSSQL
jgi:transcriptional regulator